jgi:Transposase DDE domain group 1
MSTECKGKQYQFQALESRAVVADFEGGKITSDGGGLLLRQLESKRGLLGQFAACFVDHRDPELIEHTVEELVKQRVYGLALGYEDLNDHDQLREDALLPVLVGKPDPTGQQRRRARDRGKALAGKSTLNRLELTPAGAQRSDRYKKIEVKEEAVAEFFTDLFLQAHPQAPEMIVLDADATDDPIHGEQEGRFFHGYYGEYCYLPLYIFCNGYLLCARLRPSNLDASEGIVAEIQRIVARVRQVWPKVRILVRGDSGFAREGLMSWCEAHGVDYLLGLAKNCRLEQAIEAELEQARQQYQQTSQAARRFKDFTYQTRDSWSRQRRVVGKAEYLDKGPNPRFVVTSLSAEAFEAKTLYEQLYCARGEMENRIKEQQLDLFADRTSAETLRANQVRLWFSSVAYLLLHELRQWALTGTDLAKAQCGTIRTKLLKIGAQVRISVRRIWVSLASGFPYEGIFQLAYRTLEVLPLRC